MNYALLLKREIPPEGTAARFADEIAFEGKRIAEIVQSLRRFGRGDDNVAVAAEFREIVDGTLTLIRSSLLHEGIVLRVKIEERLPEIVCRAAQLQQVIMNLVTNARDAIIARQASRTDERRITIEVFKRANDAVVLEVGDTGDGIDPVLEECIFDPFFTTKGSGGTGLGLSVSHGIVKAHGGTITCVSEPGRGACFRVEIPCNRRASDLAREGISFQWVSADAGRAG